MDTELIQINRLLDAEKGANEADSPGLTRREWAWTCVAAFAAFAVCVTFASQRGFWLDEYHTLLATVRGWGRLIENRLHAGHSPLYFFYAKLFMPLGLDVRLLRLSSALMAGVAVVGLAHLVVAAGLRRQLPAALIFAVLQPYGMVAGTQFRYMMTLIAVAAFAMTWSVRMARQPAAGTGTVLALLGGLLLWIHPTAQFVLASLSFFLIWEGISARRIPEERGATRAIARRLWPMFAAGVIGLPLLYLIRGHSEATLDGMGFQTGAFHESILGAVLGDVRLWPQVLEHRPKYYLRLLWLLLAGTLAFALIALKRQNKSTALHLLIMLLAGPPVLVLLFQALGNYFKLEPRYVASLSIPAAICFALAWNAPASRRMRWAVRCGIVVLVGLQFTASAITPDDRHREGVQWIAANANPDVAVYACVVKATSYGLRMNKTRLKLVDDIDTRVKDPETIRAWVKTGLETRTKGIAILYKTRLPLGSTLQEMAKQGELAGYRRWKISPVVEVLAFTTDAAERPWLDAVQPPKLFLGQAEEKIEKQRKPRTTTDEATTDTLGTQ